MEVSESEAPNQAFGVSAMKLSIDRSMSRESSWGVIANHVPGAA